jgi:hypothetical protein
MFELYIQQIEQQCPTEIVAEVRTVDLRQDSAGDLARKIAQEAIYAKRYDCLAAYVGFMAYKIDRQTPVEVVSDFLSAADTVPEGDMRVALAPAITHVYQQFDYSLYYSYEYFYILGSYKVDVREQFDPQFEDVKINDVRSEAFYYAYYLAQIGDPRGLQRLDQALHDSEHDVDRLIGLLSVIDGLRFKEIIPMYERYRDDHRRGTGVNGPNTSISVSESVEVDLEYTDWR